MTFGPAFSPESVGSLGLFFGLSIDSSIWIIRCPTSSTADQKERFTTLFHHLSIDLFREAFLALRRDAAPGVDGLTWQDYEADLERNLTDLHDRVHRGTYRALPSRRRYIPKADGRQRPLAIAALEDKIVQRATV